MVFWLVFLHLSIAYHGKVIPIIRAAAAGNFVIISSCSFGSRCTELRLHLLNDLPKANINETCSYNLFFKHMGLLLHLLEFLQSDS